MDIGCGTGNLLRIGGLTFEHSLYFGIDPSPDYIQKAMSDFPRARFVCGTVENLFDMQEQFDLVIASGVLHHIGDAGAIELMEFAVNSVSPSGVIITVDPVTFNGQGRFARFMVEADRGQHVRSVDVIKGLWASIGGVGRLSVTTRSGYMRFPYDHVVCVIRR